jgi:cob(I)alamin adenosyltransferase
MALFTGKGDDGTTYKFDSKDRFSKDSKIAEALGTVDELNTYLGVLKIKTKNHSEEVKNEVDKFSDEVIYDLLHQIQENLFIAQAELAGAPKKIDLDKVEKMSELINSIETEIPPITTFLIAGGSEMAAKFDLARTIARRAERRVVGVVDEGNIKINKGTLAYLNRLSSMLYALARLYNHKFGINEERPSYE